MNVFTDAADKIQALKVVIVGAGHVGSATAFALLLKGLADEIVLIDTDIRKAEGEAADLAQASILGYHTDVYTGSYEDCKDASIVIVTAGHRPKPGETGRELLEANLATLKEVAPRIGKASPRAIMIVAAHPNEALTYAAAKLSGLPKHRVIGFGTSLDTARFRYELARHYNVDVRDVNASIVGEHGAQEAPLLSTITLDGLPLLSYCEQLGMRFQDEHVRACFQEAKQATFDIIERKGSPLMSMAAGLCAIVDAILRDEHSLMTVAAIGDYFGIENIALSVPTRLSRAGAQHLPGWSDSWSEEDELRSAAEQIKQEIEASKI